MKNTFLSILIATSMLSISHAYAQNTPRNSWKEVEAIFKQADVIPDGRLDAGEFDIYHVTAFNLMDTDKNSALDKNECTVNCSTETQGTDAERQRRAEFSANPYRFDAIDADKSGVLSMYEYILFARERFPYFDHDKNGVISQGEFCSAYHSSMPCDFDPE